MLFVSVDLGYSCIMMSKYIGAGGLRYGAPFLEQCFW